MPACRPLPRWKYVWDRCRRHCEVWLCGTLPGWEPPWFAFGDLETYPVTADPLVLPPAAWLAAELAEWDRNEWMETKRPWRSGLPR